MTADKPEYIAEDHPQTDQCGFDKNASIEENCYVCECGWRSSIKSSAGGFTIGEQHTGWASTAVICDWECTKPEQAILREITWQFEHLRNIVRVPLSVRVSKRNADKVESSAGEQWITYQADPAYEINPATQAVRPRVAGPESAPSKSVLRRHAVQKESASQVETPRLCTHDGKPCPSAVEGRGPGRCQCEQNGICQRVDMDKLPRLDISELKAGSLPPATADLLTRCNALPVTVNSNGGRTVIVPSSDFDELLSLLPAAVNTPRKLLGNDALERIWQAKFQDLRHQELRRVFEQAIAANELCAELTAAGEKEGKA